MSAPCLCNPLAVMLSREMRFMWPAINEGSHLGFSFLFDDYPDRISTTFFLFIYSAKLTESFHSAKYYLLKLYGVLENLAVSGMNVDDVVQSVDSDTESHETAHFLYDIGSVCAENVASQHTAVFAYEEL